MQTVYILDTAWIFKDDCTFVGVEHSVNVFATKEEAITAFDEMICTLANGRDWVIDWYARLAGVESDETLSFEALVAKACEVFHKQNYNLIYRDDDDEIYVAITEQQIEDTKRNAELHQRIKILEMENEELIGKLEAKERILATQAQTIVRLEDMAHREE